MVKIASGFGGYSMPMTELVAEGNIGLMQPLAEFEPERGFRFATYAIWWIRAAIKEYILHNRSLVRMGTTAEQHPPVCPLRNLSHAPAGISDPVVSKPAGSGRTDTIP